MMFRGQEIFSLSGKTALLTGAVGYLGRAMAFVLAEAGARVLVNSRSQPRCDALVADIRSEGLSAEPAVFDVCSGPAVRKYVNDMNNSPVHILINNAYAGGAGTIESSDAADYAPSYDVSVVAAHRLLCALLPNLRSAVALCGDASVINLATMYALVSPDQRLYGRTDDVNPPFYGAAKAALLQWTRYAACEFGKNGIRVNSISPGPFPPGSVQVAAPTFIDSLSRKVPLGRVGRADEMKGPVLFLASQASSYVNGANIVVDGGWTCW